MPFPPNTRGTSSAKPFVDTCPKQMRRIGKTLIGVKIENYRELQLTSTW